jgi:hypothetical protein
VPIETLLTGTKSVDVEALYDPKAYRAKQRESRACPCSFIEQIGPREIGLGAWFADLLRVLGQA